MVALVQIETPGALTSWMTRREVFICVWSRRIKVYQKCNLTDMVINAMTGTESSFWRRFFQSLDIFDHRMNTIRELYDPQKPYISPL